MKRVLLGIVCVLALQTSLYAQYVPPVGIPMPPVDVLRPRPSGGTSVSTLPATVVAGQVFVLSGSMAGRKVVCAGTATNPGWLIGGSNLKIGGAVDLEGQYCIADSLKGYIFDLGGHHNMLRDSEFSGVLTDRQMTGVGCSGTDIVIFRNKVHNFGNINAADDQDAHGIGCSRGADHVWILENESWANSGDGQNLNPYPYDAAGQTAIHHIYVGRNKNHDNKQTGFWAKQSVDIVVSENESYGHHASNSSRGDGYGFQYDTNRIWYLKNLSHDNDTCFGVSEGMNSPINHGNAMYIGNTCLRAQGKGCSPNLTDPLWSCAGFYLLGFGNSYVVNNTVNDSVDGLHAYRGTGLYVENLTGNSARVTSSNPALARVDLVTAFRTAYGLDISSLAGSTPAPPVPPPPPPDTRPLCSTLTGWVWLRAVVTLQCRWS